MATLGEELVRRRAAELVARESAALWAQLARRTAPPSEEEVRAAVGTVASRGVDDPALIRAYVLLACDERFPFERAPAASWFGRFLDDEQVSPPAERVRRLLDEAERRRAVEAQNREVEERFRARLRQERP